MVEWSFDALGTPYLIHHKIGHVTLRAVNGGVVIRRSRFFFLPYNQIKKNTLVET